MAMLLQSTDLTKCYEKGKIALDRVNITLEGGEIVGLLGTNGSGKTTFMKLAAGLLTPTSGSLVIDGNPVGIETKKAVSYLPERTYLNDWMRVSQILSFFEDFYADFDRAAAERMLTALRVPTDAKLKTLSKGTREKVQLVLVMARRAKLYLLDEPIAGVDPVAREFILKLILENRNPDSTILISTHLISDIQPILDRYIFIRDSKLFAEGAVSEIPDGKTVEEYFKEAYKCSENL